MDNIILFKKGIQSLIHGNVQKHRQDFEHSYSHLLFFYQICFYYLLEKLDIFKIKRWYKIVTLKTLFFFLLFNKRCWVLNTNKWNDEKVAQTNIQTR